MIDFQLLKQLRKNIYFTPIYGSVYHLHTTQNDEEKKIRAELYCYV